MSKLFIFDLDGTILNTIEDIHISLMETLIYFNFPLFDINTTKRYVGDGVKKLVERAVREKNFKKEHEVYFRDCYRKNLVNNTKLYDGMEDLLSNLKECFTIVVLSNKSFDMTDILIKHFNLNRYIKYWFGGDSFEEKKPSPYPIFKILELTGFSPENSYMIGDNYTDIESGKAAGSKTVFCSYGYGKLSSVKPDYIADSTHELKKILEG